MKTAFCFGPERAADIVASMTGSMKADLFELFVDYFDLTDTPPVTISDFARMSGFLILELVRD